MEERSACFDEGASGSAAWRGEVGFVEVHHWEGRAGGTAEGEVAELGGAGEVFAGAEGEVEVRHDTCRCGVAKRCKMTENTFRKALEL